MIKQNLIAHQLPLQGKHLIEASAGTGKTFNITRIYLRMLLERKLPVEKILVMTFTKDATEELRGRIDSFIRQALHHWQQLIVEDAYFSELATKIEEQEAKFLLKKALLFLDEAAIYTIHGFCKRVLSQHAFVSGLPFNAKMETDSKDVVLEACQDWYRTLSTNDKDAFLTLAEFWPEPSKFHQQFAKAIAHKGDIQLLSAEQIFTSFQAATSEALASLNSHTEFLTISLIESKKGAEKDKRVQELEQLKHWLAQIISSQEIMPPAVMPDAFIDGRRYARSKDKAQLVDIFTWVNQVKTQAKSLQKSLNKAKAYALVKKGIFVIRQQVKDKKRQLGMLDFDDLITTLADQLSNEQVISDSSNDKSERRLANLLFEQYPVALVDEFQDTDPQQFSILRSIYYHRQDAAIYMIGDPKQAIYGFRGGDVFAYLSARAECDYQWIMDTNWRSSVDMIQAYNRLFYGESLPDVKTLNSGIDSSDKVFGYDIDYIPVKASPVAIAEKSTRSNDFNDQYNALQFVHFSPVEDTQSGSKASIGTPVVKQSYRTEMANWCASEIARLLADETTKLNAQDIAILVRDGAEAQAIKNALQLCNLSAVFLSNRANLFDSEQTHQVFTILQGILFVENERLYTAALASDLLAYTPEKLHHLQSDEQAWQTLKFTFAGLRDEWLYKGFIGMALKLMHEHFHIVGENKDRIITNLMHLFELMQSASQRHRQPQELLHWLQAQMQTDSLENEAELRLESDDNLVKIVTQHGSKGLEYPVVFVPFPTRHKDPLRLGSRAISFIEYHDDDKNLCLSLDGEAQAKQAMANEAYAEAIRLLYVAITRAEKRCYLFTSAFDSYHNSPLGRTLAWTKGQDIPSALQSLVTENPDCIGVCYVTEHDEETVNTEQKQQVQALSAAKFTGKIERDWWLSSFSALSRNLRHGGVSTPDRDQDNAEFDLLVADNITRDEHLLRFQITKGAQTGNLLHDILEHTDFTAPDWAQSTKIPLLKYGELPDKYQQQDLEQWLQQILETPLNKSIKTASTDSSADLSEELSTDSPILTLSMIDNGQTLRESEFYFPMDATNSQNLVELLTRHRKNYRGKHHKHRVLLYKVNLPAYKKLKGMMHGFIDLVFCAEGKYYVCDYKSSHLGNSYHDYCQENLIENIEKNYYDLQYLIYSLALHRYLAQLVPNYQPSEHFGGIYYLYLRGMSNSPEHQGDGVFYRQITVDELNELDRLFIGEKNQGAQLEEQLDVSLDNQLASQNNTQVTSGVQDV